MQGLLQEYTKAKEAALLAAEIIHTSKKHALVIDTKSGSNDLVTQVDRLVEEKTRAFLKQHFPGYDILGEEDGGSYGKHDFCWIIDPIDGTTNFAKGIPWYAISIGLYFQGQPVLGVVHNPESGQLYHALKGSGSWLMKPGAAERRLQVSPVQSIEQSLFLTGFYYDRGDILVRTLEDMKNLTMEGCLGIRRFGAASLDLCLIAEGSAEAYFEHFLNVWDFAAGGLIASEAGAWLGRTDGGPLPLGKSSILAVIPSLKERTLEILGRSVR